VEWVQGNTNKCIESEPILITNGHIICFMSSIPALVVFISKFVWIEENAEKKENI
jgi:hypothetical protein